MAAVVSGRFEKIISFVLMISSAISADDNTTVAAQPKSKNIIGPYFLDRAWREQCGSVPSWWRLPIIGSFGGDGGNFGLPLLKCLKMYTKEKSKTKNKRTWKGVLCNSSHEPFPLNNGRQQLFFTMQITAQLSSYIENFSSFTFSS